MHRGEEWIIECREQESCESPEGRQWASSTRWNWFLLDVKYQCLSLPCRSYLIDLSIFNTSTSTISPREWLRLRSSSGGGDL